MVDPPPHLERWSLVVTGVVLSTLPAVRLALGAGPVATVLEGAVPLLLFGGVIYAGVSFARGESPAFTAVVTAWTVSVVGGMIVMAVWIVTLAHLLGSTLAIEALLPIVTSTGAISGLWLGRNDARRREHDAALRRERRRLDFLNELLRHYVLNAVQVIVGRATLLADRTDADDATVVAESGRRLARHVEQMRALARGEDERWAIDLAVAVSAVTDDLADRDDVDLAVDVPEPCPVVADDALDALIEAILFEAVDRADEDAVRLELSVRRTDDGVTVAVTDDAGGPVDRVVDPAAIDTENGVFQFQRYLVVMLADRYDGTVTVSERDGGARTEVWLPGPDEADEAAFGNP